MNLSGSTAACTTFCTNCAVTRHFRYFIRQKTNPGGRYQLIRRLTIKHVLCGVCRCWPYFYLFYLLRLDSQTQDILHQLHKLLR